MAFNVNPVVTNNIKEHWPSLILRDIISNKDDTDGEQISNKYIHIERVKKTDCINPSAGEFITRFSSVTLVNQ